MATAKLEICVLVDEDGDYGVGIDADTAAQHYAANIREIDGTIGARQIMLTVSVPLPTPIVIEAEIPESDETATVAAK